MSGARPPLTRWPLDERARAYVRDQLDVDLTLCRSLLAVFEREPGAFHTVAPETVSADHLHQFTWGGLYEEDWSRAVTTEDGSVMAPTPVAYDVRARSIRARLDADPRAFCLVDDFIGSVPETACQAEPPEVCVGHELYRFITAANAGEHLEAALQTGDEIWHGVAATFLPPTLMDPAALATPNGLSACAEFVSEINVTAYDAEGFVAWTRG